MAAASRGRAAPISGPRSPSASAAPGAVSTSGARRMSQSSCRPPAAWNNPCSARVVRAARAPICSASGASTGRPSARSPGSTVINLARHSRPVASMIGTAVSSPIARTSVRNGDAGGDPSDVFHGGVLHVDHRDALGRIGDLQNVPTAECGRRSRPAGCSRARCPAVGCRERPGPNRWPAPPQRARRRSPAPGCRGRHARAATGRTDTDTRDSRSSGWDGSDQPRSCPSVRRCRAPRRRTTSDETLGATKRQAGRPQSGQGGFVG